MSARASILMMFSAKWCCWNLTYYQKLCMFFRTNTHLSGLSDDKQLILRPANHTYTTAQPRAANTPMQQAGAGHTEWDSKTALQLRRQQTTFTPDSSNYLPYKGSFLLYKILISRSVRYIWGKNNRQNVFGYLLNRFMCPISFILP